MRRWDLWTILGFGLILIGSLMLLEKVGLVRGLADVVWGGILMIGGVNFLLMFYQNHEGSWWAVIPGLALLGMGLGAVLPQKFDFMDGGIFLLAIGLSFYIIYLSDRVRWWALIPGGVLLTLSLVAFRQVENDPMENGALLFAGLGMTFLLVAVLPTPTGKKQWAYIPSAVLFVMAALTGSQAGQGLVAYIVPVVLILAGFVLLIAYFYRQK